MAVIIVMVDIIAIAIIKVGKDEHVCVEINASPSQQRLHPNNISFEHVFGWLVAEDGHVTSINVEINRLQSRRAIMCGGDIEEKLPVRSSTPVRVRVRVRVSASANVVAVQLGEQRLEAVEKESVWL